MDSSPVKTVGNVDVSPTAAEDFAHAPVTVHVHAGFRARFSWHGECPLEVGAGRAIGDSAALLERRIGRESVERSHVMARTAIATLQVVWDCRWSQPGHGLTNVSEAEQPESRWVCTREGHRRSIEEQECETCPHWERTDDATVLGGGLAAAVVPGITLPALPTRAARTLDYAARVVTLLTAILLGASGFAILSGPLMIPFVVVLWLGAAAFGAFTFYGRFPVATPEEPQRSRREL